MDNRNLSVNDIRKTYRSALRGLYPADEINSILYILFEEFLQWPKTRVHLEPGTVLTDTDSGRFRAALEQLVNGSPVQYITGKADFNEISLIVNPHVLIPRPETAELASVIVQKLKTIDLSGFRVMDIGTGSGCLAIYIKKHCRGISVHAMDNSEKALAVARSNAVLFKAGIKFSLEDILHSSLALSNPSYNLIVSNPPYVTTKEKQLMMKNVKDFEPPAALFVTDDDPLLYYRAIARYSKVRLIHGGLLYLEINEFFGREVTELLDLNGFAGLELLKDFRGRDRFVKADFIGCS